MIVVTCTNARECVAKRVNLLSIIGDVVRLFA